MGPTLCPSSPDKGEGAGLCCHSHEGEARRDPERKEWKESKPRELQGDTEPLNELFLTSLFILWKFNSLIRRPSFVLGFNFCLVFHSVSVSVIWCKNRTDPGWLELGINLSEGWRNGLRKCTRAKKKKKEDERAESEPNQALGPVWTMGSMAKDCQLSFSGQRTAACLPHPKEVSPPLRRSSHTPGSLVQGLIGWVYVSRPS